MIVVVPWALRAEASWGAALFRDGPLPPRRAEMAPSRPAADILHCDRSNGRGGCLWTKVDRLSSWAAESQLPVACLCGREVLAGTTTCASCARQEASLQEPHTVLDVARLQPCSGNAGLAYSRPPRSARHPPCSFVTASKPNSRGNSSGCSNLKGKGAGQCFSGWSGGIAAIVRAVFVPSGL